MSQYSLGILTIATNGYVKYLHDLIQSAQSNLGYFANVSIHIFTDDLDSVKSLENNYSNIKLVAHKIESYGWPDASLKRYEIYNSHSALLTEDILMHLDADMYFLNSLEFEVEPVDWVGGMAFVEHPGYWNPSMAVGLKLYLKMKLRKFIQGGYGSWEKNPKSSAYTPRAKRRTYCCGGTWFGFNRDFLALCKILSKNVNDDSSAGVMATWHDESHLNAFVSSINSPTILSSRYCYEPKFGKLVKDPLILAIDKNISLVSQLNSLRSK